MRILIVDDSEFVRHGIRSLLLDYPELVVCGEARKGVEAIRKASELRPDLILLDVIMPGMNGLDVATVLRQELPRTKILLMSAEIQKCCCLAPSALVPMVVLIRPV